MNRVDWTKMRQLFDRARHQTDEGLLDAAEASWHEFLEIDPRNAPAWFNLGLVAKQRRAWDACRESNLRATELDPNDQAAWWNLGTAATALRDWPTARRAWQGFGLELPDGEGPVSYPCGPTPVRLNPEGNAEVVWCERIDPVRAVIRSVPLPESGHRWGDVVLNDGEPKGERLYDGRSYPVFDELARWQPSDVPTLCAIVSAPQPADIAALRAIFAEHDRAVEDWTADVRHICQACSEGRPHEHVDPGPWQSDRSLGIACEPEKAGPILQQWEGAGPGRRVDEVEAAT